MRAATPVDRVAIVTGAARGIGAATVRELAGRGYGVVALDWCAGDSHSELPYPQAAPADLDGLADAFGDRVASITADVRDPDALAEAVDLALTKWGRVDAAVAAAAVILGGAPAWHTDREKLRLLWQIDVEGVWHTAGATIPAMLAGPDPAGCRFVAVASAAASHGLFHLTAYNTVKHAVAGMIKGLAADLTGTGVTASAVSPGSTRTAMLEATAALYGLSDVEEFAGSQRIRRLLQPEEIAATIAFCCSRDGSVVNGSIIEASGGFIG